MADIIRDFTREMLETLKRQIDDDTEFTLNTINAQTSYGERVLGNTTQAQQAVVANRINILAQNAKAKKDLDKVWQEVAAIDASYQIQFDALNEYMRAYYKAVGEIADCVSEKSLAKGGGLYSDPSVFNDTVSSIKNNLAQAKADFDNALLEEALKKAGYTEDQWPAIKKQLSDFSDTYGYTYDQALALVHSVNTESDKKIFELLLEGKYSEMFRINPEGVSANMLSAISNHANQLMVTDKLDEVTKFFNAISSTSLNEDGELYPNYALEYFSYMKADLEIQMAIYCAILGENMSYDRAGNKVWPEPQDEYIKMAANYEKLQNLSSLWDYGTFMAGMGNDGLIRAAIFQDGEQTDIGEYAGFTIDDIRIGGSGTITFNFNYMQYIKKDSLDPFSPMALQSLSNGDQKTLEQLFNNDAINSAALQEALRNIEKAKQAASAKRALANIDSVLSFGANFIPFPLKEAATALLNATGEALKYLNNNKGASLQDAVSNIPDLLPSPYKDLGKLALGILGNNATYNKESEKLDATGKKTLQQLYDTWFGRGTKFSLPILDDKGKTIKAYVSSGAIDYEVYYYQKQWSQNGVSYFLNEDGKPMKYNDPQNSITGFNQNSALYNYLLENGDGFNKDNPSPEDWINAVNGMSDEEKLAWFGKDPSGNLGLAANTITPPAKGVEDLTPSDIQAFDDIGADITTAYKIGSDGKEDYNLGSEIKDRVKN